MKKESVLLALLSVFSVVCIQCSLKTPQESSPPFDSSDVLQATAIKWYNGHKAAVSITYDIGLGTGSHPFTQSMIDSAIQEVIRRDLRMDFEMVTDYYFLNPERRIWLDIIKDELMPNGIHVFGHGHKHINHDQVGYDWAFESFSLCYSLMQQWDLNPKVYAYPQSAGHKAETQQANRDAGFIAARGGVFDRNAFYICTDAVREPENWYYLPSVPVAANERPDYVRSHSEIVEILDNAIDRGSWVILMYHMIGLPNGWGYYPFEEFIEDLESIIERDFWCGNFDDVTVYIKERNAFSVNLSEILDAEQNNKYWISFTDSLDNLIYNHPLTVELSFNPDRQVEQVHFSPPINSKGVYAVTDGKLRLNVLPDERKYQMELRGRRNE